MFVRFRTALSVAPAVFPRALRRALRLAVRQPGLLFGVFGIVILWTGVLYSLSAERQAAIDNAFDDSANFARAFQEQIAGTVRAIDQTLLYVRASYLRAPDQFDIGLWSEHGEFLTNPAFQVAIIDKNGYLRATSLGPLASPVDLRDREHFRFQAAAADDRLIIGKPVTLRVTDKWAIQFTRRMIGPDGSFAGVVSVSFDPFYLSRFYQSLNLGSEGAVVLVGADGIIRARAPDGLQAIGRSLANTPLMRLSAHAPNGSLEAVSVTDGIRRIYSYRAVEGYPLLVAVGIGEDDALAGYRNDRSSYLTLAAVVSLLLLVITALLARHQLRVDRAREDLRASEARYAEESKLLEVTLDNMTQGIMLIDAGLTLRVVNRRAAELMNLPEALLATRPSLRDVLRIAWQRGDFGPCAEAYEDWFERFLSEHAGPVHVREHHQANGSIVEVWSSNLADGSVVRTFTDITERRRAEDALRAARDEATRSAQAKSEFLAMMSHEIRSPMSGLLGVVELLHDTGLDPEQREMVDLVRGSGASLLRVLNDVLDFSKVDAGMVELQIEPTDLREFVGALIGSIAPNAVVKGILLSAEVAVGVPARISTDPARLRQILVNLLGNAVKFTAAGSVRLVIAEAILPGGDAALSFAVSDSGIGIAPDSIGRLFEPFAQADASTTRMFGGTGLGLTISRRLARLLGGNIAVTSELGRGSVFTLCVPRVVAGPDAAVAPAPNQDVALPALRILVAEDQLTNRWLLDRQLKRLGCSVAAVEDGRAALAALELAAYDMLITDCHMPEIDGVALARMIRAAEAARGERRMPILGLTADTTTEMHARCVAAGMNEVAAKPIDLRQLRAAIARLVPGAGVDAVTADSHGDAAVFDPATWRDLFADDAAEGREWLAAYLDTAADLLTLAEQSVGRGDRAALAVHTHKLASASLAAGAMRLGMLGRQLEAAAVAAPDAELRRLAVAVAAASRDAQAAIRQCLRTPEPVA